MPHAVAASSPLRRRLGREHGRDEAGCDVACEWAGWEVRSGLLAAEDWEGEGIAPGRL